MHTATRSASSRITRATSRSTRHAVTRSQQATRLPRVTVASSASLGPLETIVQTLNNCGPSSVAAVLAYWHMYRSEAQVAAVPGADNGYWGMSPVDLPAYARSLGMRALVGYGGSEKLVKLLVANGFPVIASQYVSSTDPLRHYNSSPFPHVGSILPSFTRHKHCLSSRQAQCVKRESKDDASPGS